MLQPDALSILPPQSTTPQVQEAILKEPLRTIEGIEDLKKGHSLEDYYCAHITSLLKVPLHDLTTIETKNLLQPTQSGKAYAMVKKKLSGGFSCALMLEGSFLQIQMGSDQNDFRSLPLTAESTETLSTVSFDIYLVIRSLEHVCMID